MTEQKAWELLSLIDQIHIWGVTEHRDFVKTLLREWHDYCSDTYEEHVKILGPIMPGLSILPDGRYHLQIPIYKLPSWVDHLTPARCKKVQAKATAQFLKAYITNFRPHPAGHIEALFSLVKRFELDGEGLEQWTTYDATEEEGGCQAPSSSSAHGIEPITLTLRPDSMLHSANARHSLPVPATDGVKRSRKVDSAESRKRRKGKQKSCE